MTRRTARETPDAESVGANYAEAQIAGDYFMDWVREQMLEASQADPSAQLPLKTKADARVIAGNMLKQLEWDTKRELRGQELTNLIGSGARPGDSEPRPSDVAGFYDGFRKACDNSRDWLADELLTIKGGMGGVGEDRRRGYHGNESIRVGALVMVINPDSMYRSEKGTVVELDARRSAKLDNFNRERVRKGAVLVERSNGSLFVVDSRDLVFYTPAPEAHQGHASEKHRSPPITRVVISKVRNGWIMKVYDSAGHLRSGVSTPSSLEYVKRKAEEWFPGVPVEQEEETSSRPKAVGSVRRRR